LPQQPANTKIKTQSDLKTWYRFCSAEKGEKSVTYLKN